MNSSWSICRGTKASGLRVLWDADYSAVSVPKESLASFLESLVKATPIQIADERDCGISDDEDGIEDDG